MIARDSILNRFSPFELSNWRANGGYLPPHLALKADDYDRRSIARKPSESLSPSSRPLSPQSSVLSSEKEVA